MSENCPDKKRGRPAVGVTPDRLYSYRSCIFEWIKDGRLMSWLKNPKDHLDAQHAFEQTSTATEDAHTIDEWCKTWLSESGWKRLQANVRQKAYVRGSWKDGRERMRTLQIPTSTLRDLRQFAEKRNMTINQAIKQMLENND